jgi:hypothetical protein
MVFDERGRAERGEVPQALLPAADRLLPRR